MNRGTFLKTLIGLPAGLIAAAKALAASPSPLNLDEIFNQLYQIRKNRELTAVWFQQTRTMHCCSLPYEDAIDVAFGIPEPERKANFIARRKIRFSADFEKLRRSRPLPLP